MKSDLSKTIAKDLSLPTSWVEHVILKAPFSYKEYRIPKKRGGYREIAQPSKKTKYLQYWIIDNVLSGIPIHASSAAYVKGKSIVDNARYHSSNQYIAKFDFVNFFQSISSEDLKFILVQEGSKLKDFNSEDIRDIVRICFRKSRKKNSYHLSVGAPSSPMISNIVMRDFDLVFSEKCKGLGFKYTRYADDITVSTNQKGALFGLEKTIIKALEETHSPNLTLNFEKTVFSSKKFQRRVTGLIINNDGNVSIGRERKRLISSMVHHYSCGDLPEEDIAKLKGLLSFVKMSDPTFLYSLIKKYGVNNINQIMHQ